MSGISVTCGESRIPDGDHPIVIRGVEGKEGRNGPSVEIIATIDDPSSAYHNWRVRGWAPLEFGEGTDLFRYYGAATGETVTSGQQIEVTDMIGKKALATIKGEERSKDGAVFANIVDLAAAL